MHPTAHLSAPTLRALKRLPKSKVLADEVCDCEEVLCVLAAMGAANLPPLLDRLGWRRCAPATRCPPRRSARATLLVQLGAHVRRRLARERPAALALARERLQLVERRAQPVAPRTAPVLLAPSAPLVVMPIRPIPPFREMFIF